VEKPPATENTLSLHVEVGWIVRSACSSYLSFGVGVPVASKSLNSFWSSVKVSGRVVGRTDDTDDSKKWKKTQNMEKKVAHQKINEKNKFLAPTNSKLKIFSKF
jgi:hypothetical protein